MGVFTPVKRGIEHGMCVVGGVGLGAGLMYILDPDRGRRRRATARDGITKVLHETGDAFDKGLRDLNNRVSGIMMEAVSVVAPQMASDEVLSARVRAALGRVVSHPHAIKVGVKDGKVTLSGAVLKDEVARLVKQVHQIRGVAEVINNLQVYTDASESPDLQGKRRPPREMPAIQWTPATRLAAATAGSFLAVYGAARRGLIGFGYGVAGLGLVMRAIVEPSRSFAATSELERGVDIQKTITIDAPLERVYRLLSNPENFSRFMSHVKEVKKLDNGGYQWSVVGPLGAVEWRWQSDITRMVPNELLEWKSRPGAMMENAGIIRFDPTPYGTTRVHIRTSYRPPAGMFGNLLAEFFKIFPKRVLDADLSRVKSLLEQGRTTAHHHKVKLDDVATV